MADQDLSDYSHAPQEACERFKDFKYGLRIHWGIENLIDIVAKGGNFMVGIGPDLTGRFHPKALEALAYAGQWLKVNGQVIYATRPWDHWQEGQDVRFTQSKDHKTVYIITKKWPGRQFTSGLVTPVRGSQITMLGVEAPLPWASQDSGIMITIPERLQMQTNRPCQQAYVFRVTVNPDAS